MHKPTNTITLLLALILTLITPTSHSAENDWALILAARFGNIDAIDAEDGDLARFIKNIRNDGRFPPPMRTLVGPEIRNPTFFGVTIEGWIECAILTPPTPGPTQTVWAFPVDNRDEYLTQMTSQGLTEYEGMDGVTILRELDPDGTIRTYHLQWLPGNVAVFGSHRDSVIAARRIYADRSAARGLLHNNTDGRYLNPDVTIRLDLPALASWQNRETGNHWWRDKIDKLTRDLINYWNPGTARQRLVWNMADALALWPRTVKRLDASLWFEPEGIEFRIETDGQHQPPKKSQLTIIRNVPDRTALAFATPVTPASLELQCDWIGKTLLEAAGGVVTREARENALALKRTVADGGLRESAAALVPPPIANPELGGAQLIVMDWQIPEQADKTWDQLKTLLGSDETIANALSQMGLKASVETEELDPGSLGVTIRSAQDPDAPPYYKATWSYRRNGNIVALVTGVDRDDKAERDKLREYRGSLAATTVSYGSTGGPDARAAFTRMGPDGAAWLGFFEPVRFLQFCLIEAGDWRPRSPDQLEPVSTQLAREMLEYHSGRAWTAVGESRVNHWRFDGGLTWDSLSRLAAALGITESIGM